MVMATGHHHWLWVDHQRRVPALASVAEQEPSLAVPQVTRRAAMAQAIAEARQAQPVGQAIAHLPPAGIEKLNAGSICRQPSPRCSGFALRACG
jgi:hypothetical protein